MLSKLENLLHYFHVDMFCTTLQKSISPVFLYLQHNFIVLKLMTYRRFGGRELSPGDSIGGRGLSFTGTFLKYEIYVLSYLSVKGPDVRGGKT
jgi:hypothetical protein